MLFEKVRYVIAVPDLDRSAAWYRDVMGFAVHGIGDPGWRVFERDACVVMAGECPDATPAHALGDHSYFAYVTVESAAALDAYHADVAARGADLLKAPRDEPWGMREFGVRTVDGHRIMFGTPRAVAGGAR